VVISLSNVAVRGSKRGAYPSGGAGESSSEFEEKGLGGKREGRHLHVQCSSVFHFHKNYRDITQH